MRDFLAEVYAIWVSERPAQLAAALAYYGMFSFAPVIYIAFTIAGIFIDELAVAGQLYEQLQKVLGPETAEQVRKLVLAVSNTAPSGSFLFSLISFLALFFAASGLFFQIQYALNMVWRVPPPKKGHTKAFIRKRLLSFIMVMGVGLLLIATVLVNVLLAWFGSLVSRFIGTGESPQLLTLVASLGLITVSFILLYKLLPDVKVAWRDVWPGALAAAVLVMLAGALAAIYFRVGSLSTALEAAGAFAVILIAIYYIAQIFLLGAVITRVYSGLYGSRKSSPELTPE
jgi:membrane protein